MTPTKTGPAHDSKTDLLEAARAVVKDREEKASAEREARMHPAQRRRIGFLSLVGLAGLVILILQPLWLVGPASVPPETPAVAAASLRLTLLRERQRIFEFVKRSGRLPSTLAEAEVSLPGIGYEQVDSLRFKLYGQAGDSLVVLNSSESMSAFLGKSLSAIKDRGRP